MRLDEFIAALTQFGREHGFDREVVIQYDSGQWLGVEEEDELVMVGSVNETPIALIDLGDDVTQGFS